MKNIGKVALALSAAGTLWGGALPALAQESIEELKAMIRELDQKVRVLERKQELDKEVAIEKSKSAVAVSAGASGFNIRSAETNFLLKVRAYIQADSRWFLGDAEGAHDTFLMRRVRPIFEGTVFDKYDYKVMLDFASGTTSSAANNGFTQEAYMNARLWPQFQIQAGKFKEPVGLERLQSGANLLFVERGYPTQLVPNRDVGIQLQGDLLSGGLSYAAGVFNGVADGGSGDLDVSDGDKDFAGRLFAHPFKNSEISALKGFGIGVAGTYGDQEGTLRPFLSPGKQIFGYRTGSSATGPNVVADGAHARFTPQGYYYLGPFGLFGEYVISSQEVKQDGTGAGAGTRATLQHKAWQVAVSYILTGEENSYKPLTPRKPFSLGNDGWGAWELTARVNHLDVDDDAFPIYANPATAVTEAISWGVGLNWHLNRNLKVQLNYEHTNYTGGGPVAGQDENIILTRAQVSF